MDRAARGCQDAQHGTGSRKVPTVTERTARRLAHGLWLGTMGGWLTGIALALAEGAANGVPSLLIGLPIVLYSSLGALVARRRPDNPIGWLFGLVASPSEPTGS